MTANAKGIRKLGSEFQLCSAYFTFVSWCFANKKYTRKLSAEHQRFIQKMARDYDKHGKFAAKIALQATAIDGQSPAEFSRMNDIFTKMVFDRFAGNCANLGVPQDKFRPFCKQLVNKFRLRLKKLN